MIVRLIIILLVSINSIMGQNNVKYFGHRGCRGLYPENTIEGFKKAIELGVDGIEWDVVVNKDHELIISHEPFIDTNYCLNNDGSEIKVAENRELNIYKMSTNQIKQFDCGLKTNKRFSKQEKSNETKPTFKEAEIALKEYKGTILFEIKSNEKQINTFYPEAKKYAEIIYENLKNSSLLSHYIFMSFDPKIINELNKLFPKAKFIFLIDQPFKTLKQMKKKLTFKPFGLGLNYKLATKKIITNAHQEKTKIYAWTVNKIKDSNELIKMGIDGIITDYPNLLITK